MAIQRHFFTFDEPCHVENDQCEQKNGTKNWPQDLSIYPYGHKKSVQHKLAKFANMTLNMNICPCTNNGEHAVIDIG